MSKPINRTLALWVLSAALLISFAYLLYLSQGISAIDSPTIAVEVVIVGIVMAFVSFALAKIDGNKQRSNR